MVNLNFCIFWSCYFNGGVSSPTLPWVLIIPILSFFYIGGDKRLQVTLLAISGTCGIVFLSSYFYFAPPPNDIPEYAMVGLGMVSTVASLAYVATMAIYYSRIFDAGVELEKEVRRRRIATEELRKAVARADREGLMKAEFLARMSHELRTPLNSVIGYSQLLKDEIDDAIDEQTGADIDKINDAGQYLLRLINMILDLSKIEAGRMQFNINKTHLPTVLKNVVDGTRAAILQNENEVELHIGSEIETVETDEERLVQILDSILQNAATHTQQGSISVRCDRGSDEAGSIYTIAIADSGTGIPPERLKTLFQTLTDSRDASASKYGGTGLNLTVTHRLSQAMGCSVEATSTVGEGTCFTIRIPARWAGVVPEQAPEEPVALSA